MAIDSKQRGKGIGRKLIESMLRRYKGKIYLMAPKSTIKFYEKFGFKKTKKTQKGRYHTYTRMERDSKK